MAWTRLQLEIAAWAGISLLCALALIHKSLFRLPGAEEVDFVVGVESPAGRRLNRELDGTSSRRNYRTVTPLQVGFCRDECRAILVDKKRQLTCEQLLYRTASKLNISLIEAVTIEIDEYGHHECEPCYAEFCDYNAKLFWRYDDAAPTILGARSSYLTTIHRSWRIPSRILGSGIVEQSRLVGFFSKHVNVHPTRHYLFEYNPSIIKLSADQASNSGESETPMYLASYRVSTQQNCFHPNITLQMIGGNWTNRPRQHDYLGLALLRSNLTMIDEVVVALPTLFGHAEDFRLFSLHNQIYVGSFCRLAPLWLQQQPGSMQGKVVLRNTFRSQMKVFIGTNFTYCSSYWKDTDSAKNLNYFVDDDNKTVVEMNPLDPHIIHKVDLVGGKAAAPAPENATVDTYMPRSSFKTVEDLDLPYRHNFYESPFTSHRGGACCVPFSDPRRRSLGKRQRLLLGVAHLKTPFRRQKLKDVVKENQYLSRWYALEPKAPYRVVAMSGLFCLPINPSSSMETSRHNPYENLPRWTSLDIAGRTYHRCPSIHFISGITEQADDPSRLIVAYGVSDCTSWFIEISKSEVIGLLFNPPRAVEALE